MHNLNMSLCKLNLKSHIRASQCSPLLTTRHTKDYVCRDTWQLFALPLDLLLSTVNNEDNNYTNAFSLQQARHGQCHSSSLHPHTCSCISCSLGGRYCSWPNCFAWAAIASLVSCTLALAVAADSSSTSFSLFNKVICIDSSTSDNDTCSSTKHIGLG